VRPTAVPDLPPQCAALNRAYVSVNELTVRAALEGRPEYVRLAMMADPNASATLTVEQIWALCDDMVRAHGDLLPEALRNAV
jgi:alpha-galactosidase